MIRNYRQERERCGLTISEAAARLNISVATLRSYERGNTSPNAACLIGMCKLYGSTADYLLGVSGTSATGQSLSPDESKIIEHYRACNPQWKKTIAMTAQSSAMASKKHPNIIYMPPKEAAL